MSSENARKCPYCDSSEWEWLPNLDNDYVATCSQCERVFGWECKNCGDPWEGVVYEDDFECDWINYGHNVVECPVCDGSGHEWLDKAGARFVLQRERDGE